MASTRAFRKVGVLGLGLMGTGIAQVTAAAGITVVGFDASAAQAAKAMDSIKRSLAALAAKAVKKGAMEPAAADAHVASSLSRLSTSGDRGALGDCDLVIEAAPEDWAFKARLYRELRAQLRGDAALASNTSGLLIGDLAREFGDPTRVIGMHYFNPVPLMALCEVVALPSTAPAITSAAVALVRAQGKTPVLCTDTPGFVVNRLLVPFLAQAVAMHDRGVASTADIDAAMKLGTGHPMGPLQLADYVGLDTTLSSAWAPLPPPHPPSPHPLQSLPYPPLPPCTPPRSPSQLARRVPQRGRVFHPRGPGAARGRGQAGPQERGGLLQVGGRQGARARVKNA